MLELCFPRSLSPSLFFLLFRLVRPLLGDVLRFYALSAETTDESGTVGGLRAKEHAVEGTITYIAQWMAIQGQLLGLSGVFRW